MHFGIISPPVPGHLHPFGALGRELIARGHRVTVFHMRDLEERVRREDLEFVAVGESDHPPGTLAESLRKIAGLSGLAGVRFTVEAVRKTTEMMCRDGPAAMRGAAIEFLLVDQMEPAGSCLAEHLGIPFVTICNALLLNREPLVPPPFLAWPYRAHILAAARNQIGYALNDWMLQRIRDVVARYREQWGLAPLRHPSDTFSKLAQISQQPIAFDYPRLRLPSTFHYAGPLRRSAPKPIPFPWERLDGRPLVYGSLGTLQNRREATFRCFAEACAGLDVQVVLTHGGGLDEESASRLPGDPLVVSYAPQLELLARASLTLTHAGLNTVLDSLTYGVPLVAVPITFEQPGIASRIEWSGTGRIVRFSELSAERLRAAMRAVLNERSYKANAERVRDSIAQSGGVRRAADVILGCERRVV